MFNEDALSDPRMALQHHVAASLARPALEQQTKSPLESRRERPEERASIAFRARAVLNFDRQSWMDDGWRGGRGGIFPDYWGVVKRRTAAD